MVSLDSTDRALLSLLQQDCKQTTKQLALQLNLSVTAVYERVKKLEKQGIIKQYVALLDNEKLQQNFVAFCHVKLIQHSREFVMKFEKEVANLEEVVECYHISGDYDYLLKVVVSNMQDFRNFMVSKLTTIQHIGSTHSMFMINQVKHTTSVPLP